MQVTISDPKSIIEIITSAKVAKPREAHDLLRNRKVVLDGRVITQGSLVIYPEDTPATLRVGRYHVIELVQGE